MWKEYSIITSPSHKRLIKGANATVPDDTYEKEQKRIERKRKQQEEIAERRYTLSYGSPKEKEQI